LQELHDATEGALDQGMQEDTHVDGFGTDLQVLQARPEGFPWRRRKTAMPIGTSILCRSARLEKINKGFNSTSSGQAAPASSSTHTSKGKGKHVHTMPLMMDDGPANVGHSVPNVPPAPHLSVANVQAIGEGFCKMHPSVVS
jgi:hypothetical protein